MCGIVGYISPWVNGFQPDEISCFRDMLVADSLRGFDSTGVFGVSNKGNVEIMKDAVTGAQFVTTQDFSEFSKQALSRGQFLVGHNRWATKGAINPANAHPFWVDDHIVLVHNGTIRDDHKKHADVEVDSHAIAHLLAKEENIASALQKVNGAYALVWYNVKTKTLHMIRNNERPLYVADVKDDGVMFASEPEFILMAASRNTQSLKRPPELLETYMLHSYKLDNEKSWVFEETKVDASFRYKWPEKTHNHTPVLPDRTSSLRLVDLSDDDYSPPFAVAGHYQGQASHQGTGKVECRVGTTFHEYCFQHRFTEFHTTEDAAKHLNDICKTGKDNTHNIQLFDYLPVNNNPNCASWYIIGQALDVADDEPKRLYYRLMYDKTEDEVIAMVVDKVFYNVTVSGSQVMILDRTNEKSSMNLCVFYDETPLEILSGENNVH